MTIDKNKMFTRAAPLTRRDWFALIFIVLIASWMRLSNIDISEFAKDEAQLSIRAQGIALGHSFPLLGTPSSIGTSTPPIAIYLLAIPYLVGANPVAAVSFVAIVNIFAVALLWWIVRRYFGFVPALIASLLYACQLWAVYYSRKIWEPNLVSAFFLLALTLALVGFGEGKRWAQILCVPILLLAFQLHFSSTLLLPIFIWIIWQGRRNLSRRSLIFGAALAILTLTPYIAGLLQSRQPSAAAGLGSGLANTISPSGTSWAIFADVITGWGSELIFDPVAPERLHASVRLAEPIWVIVLVFILLGLIHLWRTRRAFAIFCLGWLLLPPILMTPAWIEPRLHYMLAVIPAACCLAAIGAVTFMRSRLLTVIVSGVVLLTTATQIMAWRDLMFYGATTYTKPPGFRTPLSIYLPIREVLSPYHDILTLNAKSYTGSIDDYQFLPPLLYRDAICIREVGMAEGGMMLFPSHPFATIQTVGSAADLRYPNDHPLDVSLRPGEGAYRIHKFESVPTSNLPALTPLTSAVRFDNGVTLDSYVLHDGKIYLSWGLPSATNTSYQYSVQFLDADGARINGRDTNFYNSAYWCQGDRIVTWIDVSIPIDTVTVRVGMYHLAKDGTIIDVYALNNSGQPVRGGEFQYSGDG
ncbi:MAG: hypothetical protein GC179_23715 [Anaerolineaceae bacterium]|nr:hypothetical protein [Anaerolineaceae bacterium]